MNDIQPIKDVQTKPVKYELIRENFSAIQSLVFRRAAEIKRSQNVGKGRAQIMAEDEIARDYLAVPHSGGDLASWMASVRNSFRSVVSNNGAHPVLDPIQEPQVEVSTPLQDTDTFSQKLTGRNKIVDPVLSQMIEKCRRIQPGQVWSFPVNNEEDARTLASYMSKVSAALGWRNGRKAHTYLYQIFPDKLKIKRLI